MTATLNTACGKDIKQNCDAEDILSLLDKVAKASLLIKPLRVRCRATGENTWGHCDTDFNEAGEAQGHDIIISVLNDGLLAHELAHALVNEQLSFDELKQIDPHGSVFWRALTIIVETLEG